MEKPNTNQIPKIARFSDHIVTIDNYPISRRDYFDILLLCENYIRHNFPTQTQYEYRLPIQYFKCSKAMQCIKDPEMC